MYPDPSSPIPLLTAQISLNINETPQIVQIAYGSTISWYLLCLYICTFDIACYAVIIVCGIKIRKSVVKAAQEQQQSSRAVMYNRQISITLVLQAILPCVGSLLSMLCLLTSNFIEETSSAYFMAFISMPVHWIPVLNPVITIIVVGSYRRVVFKKFYSS